MSKCKKCGEEVNGKFCINCGEPAPKEETACPKCGEPHLNNSKFCANCGYSYIGGNSASTIKGRLDKGVAFVKEHKKPFIVGGVGFVLALTVLIVLIVTLSNIFRASKVNNIELGFTKEQVEKQLGEPDEKEDWKWEYYGGDYGKLLEKQAKLEAELESATSDSKIEKIFNEMSEIDDQLENLEYPYIAIYFDEDGKVEEVKYNACKKDNGEEQEKVLNEKKSNIILVGIKGEDYLKCITELYYEDGSYLLEYINTTGECTYYSTYSESKYLIKWDNSWGEYEYTVSGMIYSISFSNTKDLENPNITKFTAKSDNIKLEPLPSTDVDGYTFSHWENSAGDTVTEIKKGTTSSIYLEAVWTPTVYTITYNDTKEQTHTNPVTITKDSEAVTLVNLNDTEEYVFLGWHDGEKFVETIEKGVLSNITLTAKWSPIYTITYLDTKDKANTNPVKYSIKDEIQLISLEDTDEYVFFGWHNGEEYIEKIEKGTEGNLTLTAKWLANIDIALPSTSYTRDGDYIYFGEYPQTIKADDVKVLSRKDARGYYLGSDGEWYAKVVATPHGSGYTFSNDASVVDGTTYYFKVEPIRWRILSESDGTALILCDSIIASHRYDDSSNNYKESEIRAWLNNEFYNTAFTDLQKEIILTTTVDNSVESTGYSSNEYACEDTEDKIFLLSYKEVTNSSYGFSTSTSSSTTREMLTSDYSRATGAYMSTSSSYHGNGIWWLRSPDYSGSEYACCVSNNGVYKGICLRVFSLIGVVPALQIQL